MRLAWKLPNIQYVLCEVKPETIEAWQKKNPGFMGIPCYFAETETTFLLWPKPEPGVPGELIELPM